MSNVGIHYHVHQGDALEIAHEPATYGLPQYFVVRFGHDLSMFVNPPELERLRAKIDAALAGIRTAIAADPEIAEAVDAVRGAVEECNPWEAVDA
jgi:hypothetical protein